MAKFFLTNKEEWYLKTKEQIGISDFELAFDYAKNGVYALTTHKLKIKNTNAYHDTSDNFVIATGTAIYKESLNYSCVLNDIKSDTLTEIDIENLRKNTIGHYAYVLKINKKITILGDAVGTYNIYYFYKDGYYFISNFLYDMAYVLKGLISVNEMNVIENAIRRGILRNETFYNEIKRLGGDEFIQIQDKSLDVCEISQEWPIDAATTIKERAQQMAYTLQSKARIVSKVLGAPNVCMTGGLDSRMSVAAYLSIGIKPTLSFGVSNTHIAFPEPKDAEIVQMLAEQFSLNINLMQWDTRHPDVSWDKYLQRYGFLYYLWGGVDCVMDFFEEQKEKICTQGYFGEMYRNLPYIEEKNTSITLEELMTYYFSQSGYNGVDQEIINEHVKKKLQWVANKYQIDTQHIQPEDVFYFYLEYRKVADSVTMNYVNLIRYSELLLMENDILALSRIPLRMKDDAKLMLTVMYELYPSILDVPVFTHHQLTKFNKKDMKLYTGKDVQRSDLVLLLKEMYHQMKFLKPLRDIFKKVENERNKKSSIDEVTPKNDDNSSHYSDNWHNTLTIDLKLQEKSSQLYHTMEKKAIDSLINVEP